MRTFLTLLLCVSTLLAHAVGIQRMGIRAGTKVLLKSKGISRVATQCLDNTLDEPKVGMKFMNILTDGTARVVSTDGSYLYNKSLKEAVEAHHIEIIGTGGFREMTLRNTTSYNLKIEFGRNTIIAKDKSYTMAGMRSSYLDLGQKAGWKSKNLLNQEQLQDLGYYKGTIDGDMREATKKAIREFQEKNGLQVTGTITPETDAKLIELRKQFYLERISEYQKALQRIGEYDGIIDGIHGPKSEQAFLNFFRKSGIENTIDLRRGYFYKEDLLLKKIEQFYLKNLDTDNLSLFTIERTDKGYLITKKGDLSPTFGPVTQLNDVLEEIGNSQTLFDLKGFSSSEFDAFKLTIDAHKNAGNLILMNRSSMKDLGTYSDVFNSHYTSYKMGNIEKLSENNYRLEASFATGTGATQKLTLWAKSIDALNKLKDKIKALFSSNPSVRSLDILKGLKRNDAPIYKGIFNGAEFGKLDEGRNRIFFLHEKMLAVA